MNTHYPLLIAIATMVMFSCSVIEENDANEGKHSIDLVFEATNEGNVQTKTAVQSDGKSVWWNPHEKINIFFGDSESSLFTSTNDEPVAKAQFRGTIEAFTGEVDGNDANYFWGVYPYNASNSCDGNSITATLPSRQTACAETFADNQWLTVARSQGLALSFRAVCAGFRFSVTKEGVKSVTFRGNNNEILAGKARIGLDENNLPKVLEIVTEEREITLSAPAGETLEVGTLYYMTFFPNNFTNGFTVTFNTYTESGTRVYENPKDFKRTDVHRGLSFDIDVVYEEIIPDGNIVFADEVVKATCVEKWDTDGDGELSYEEAAAVDSFNVRWPSTITSFDEFQFFTNVTSIGEYAFQNCSQLVSIVIPESVTSIGKQAFQGCTKLSSIIIPNGVTNLEFGSFALSGLESITIPSGVTSIGEKVFYGCTALTSVTILDGVTHIGDSAFEGCTNLISISLPELSSVGESVFENCNNLTSVTIQNGIPSEIDFPNDIFNIVISSIDSWINKEYYWRENWSRHLFRDDGTEITDLIIPEGPTVINDSAFSGCSFLTSITIPESVTSIGDHTFQRCI